MAPAVIERLSPSERLISCVIAAEELVFDVCHTDENRLRLYGKGPELFALGSLGRAINRVWESGNEHARDYIIHRAMIFDSPLYTEALKQASVQG